MKRLRLQFQKIGRIRFTSHKDLVRIFQRCFAASRLPICYTKGFHPHPKVSLGPPLRTGWEGFEEYMDIFLDERLNGTGEKMNKFLPDGLRITRVESVDEGIPKLVGDIRAARFVVEMGKDDVLQRYKDIKAPSIPGSEGAIRTESSEHPIQIDLAQRIERSIRECLNNGPASLVTRAAPGTSAVPDKPILSIPQAAMSEPVLLELSAIDTGGKIIFEYLSTMPSGRCFTPGDLLSPVFGNLDEFEIPPRVARKALFVERDGAFLSPISKGVVRISS